MEILRNAQKDPLSALFECEDALSSVRQTEYLLGGKNIPCWNRADVLSVLNTHEKNNV